MSVARKCDRCGVYHDCTINKLIARDTIPFEYNEREYDLCDECFEEFNDFMNGVKPKNLLERLNNLIK